MKKSTVIIIVIALLIIWGLVFYLYNINVSKKQLNENLKHAEEIMNLNSKISELEEKLEKQSNKNVIFDSSKMKSDSTSVIYKENNKNLGSSGLEIEIKDGKPYLSTDIENEQYKFLFSEVTEPINNQEITGFKLDVKEVYYAFLGNGDMRPVILFLMEDGTVEFANSSKMLQNKKYQTQGKIEELSNIVKFVNLDANDVDENGELLGGFITVAAIDEDGYAFDLSASKTIQDSIE